ncbi:hypothetical protein GQ473_03055 [archaeon]|nr:hypothetical protein [archaeon]
MSNVEQVDLETMSEYWERLDGHCANIRIHDNTRAAMSKKDWRHVKNEIQTLSDISFACTEDDTFKRYYFHSKHNKNISRKIIKMMNAATRHEHIYINDINLNNFTSCTPHVEGSSTECGLF